MAQNLPGPYEVRIVYTTTVSGVILPHTQRLNCNMDSDIGTQNPFSSWNVLQRGGGQGSLQSAVDQWIIFLQPFFHTTSQFVGAELWKYPVGSTDAEFRASYAIADPGTQAVVQTVPAAQAIMTFRTLEGGIMRLNFMETTFPAAAADPSPFADAGVSALASYCISSVGWVLGRDTSYPNVALNWLPGQNEKLFKLRYR